MTTKYKNTMKHIEMELEIFYFHVLSQSIKIGPQQKLKEEKDHI